MGSNPALNDVTNLFTATTMTGLANKSYVQTWNLGSQNWNAAVTYTTLGKWGAGVSVPMPLGTGLFFYNNGSSPAVVTYAGQVLQGTSVPVRVLPGNAFSVVGAPVPIGGTLTNAITGLAPGNKDYVQTWNTGIQNWNAAVTYTTLGKWGASPPTINPGQAFFYYNNNAANTWNCSFTVN